MAMIKLVPPRMAQTVVDWAIQILGGGGTSNDHFLAAACDRPTAPAGR
ncbi:acyl-CoA dehydrogenase family protein [Bradyrhizobium sp.]|nr:acyl-CoA dehydrogenase family protein [Bradyrhizobium sp.]